MSKNIIAIFKDSDGWIEGLTPKISIYDADSPTDSAIISAQDMTEFTAQEGKYYYEFTGYDQKISYIFNFDGGASISDNSIRYMSGDNSIDKTRVAFLVFENTFTSNNHTQSIKYKYDTKANADTHDKSTGLIGRTQIDVHYDGDANPDKITEVEI